MKSSERSTSLWEAGVQLPTYPSLAEDAKADVCVIGGGIAGLTTAYLLAGEGRDVVLLERVALGGGETGQTSAHLASVLDEGFVAIERMHGRQGVRLGHESHRAAIERIESIVAAESIDCDFGRTDGYLFTAPDADPGTGDGALAEELAAAGRAGFAGVERLDRVPVDFWDSGPCLRFPGQARFHPLRYLEGLARAAERRGVRIHTGTEVSEPPVGGSSVRVQTAGGPVVTASAAVVATNYPISRWLAIVPKLAPYRTYVVGLSLPRGSVPGWLYWDTADPYHYVRVAPDAGAGRDILVVGGEDHKTGQADDADARFARLEAWARERFPMAEGVAYRWSGQVLEPVDGMAYIGPHPGQGNLWVITGDSGQGLTHGTLGAMLVADLMHGRRNEWSELYDPSRSGLAGAADLAREGLNVAAQYADLLVRRDVASTDEIEPGSGAVVREGVRPVAVYRDAGGGLHRFSALCTHLECVVRWNGHEESWDCPCHGSRFAPDGRVLTGPAVQPLKPLDE